MKQSIIEAIIIVAIFALTIIGGYYFGIAASAIGF